MDLQISLKQAGGVYKLYASRLEKLGILKLEDFLYHIPTRFEDYSNNIQISKLQIGDIVTIKGKVIDIKNIFTKSFKKIQQLKISDDTGTIDCIFFNQAFLIKVIHKEDIISISGKVEMDNNKLIFKSPNYEILQSSNFTQKEPIHTGRLIPIYPETKGVSSKWIRRQVYKILYEYTHDLKEYIPYSIIDKFGLMSIKDAFEQIHFPKDMISADKARYRLSFDELFLIQLSSHIRRQKWHTKLTTNAFEISKYKNQIDKFWESLPFTLTNAQIKAVNEILSDLEKETPMNRLLEGDVGSGKTIVGTIAMYLAYLNGFQSVLMAPTEILAGQHFETIKKLLEPLGVTVGLATGSKKLKIENSKLNILVGTHAVLSNKLNFEKLGLVIIDEQQRFGVEQRAIIRNKGKNPHLLTMTATPIPRTIALTLYGDLDLSVIDEMPKNRKQIKTWLVSDEKRNSAYNWIEKEIINNKSQAFVICPFIEESENMQTVKAATTEFEKLKKEIFPNLKLSLLHGKLKGAEKDKILQDFRDKKFDILVATPVVEVGIDIPNATIIVIEGSERFGLSQLHQLRGRVGRGDKQSYCLLFTESKNIFTINKLKSLEKIYFGAELAELDLKLRGAGDIYGKAQHGFANLKVASFGDITLIEKAKKASNEIFPELNKYPLLEEKLTQITTTQISPD